MNENANKLIDKKDTFNKYNDCLTGNIGDVLIRTGEIEEAAKMYHRQLALARQYRERTMEATSYSALGLANRLMKRFDKALGFHTQELTLRQEICDMLGKLTCIWIFPLQFFSHKDFNIIKKRFRFESLEHLIFLSNDLISFLICFSQFYRRMSGIIAFGSCLYGITKLYTCH